MIALCVSLRMGLAPWLMFFTCFVAMVAFYTAHWQTYVTGTLKFGKMDVTEAQLSIYCFHMITALFGDAVWQLSVSSILEFEIVFMNSTTGIYKSI